MSRPRRAAGDAGEASELAVAVRSLLAPPRLSGAVGSAAAYAGGAGAGGASASLAVSAQALAVLDDLECSCSATDGAHGAACAQARYAAARARSFALRDARAALVARAVGSGVAGGRHAGGVRGYYLEEAQAVFRQQAAAAEAASHALFLAQNAADVALRRREAGEAPAAPARTVIGGADDFPALSRARGVAAAAAGAGAATLQRRPRVKIDLHGQHATEACALLRQFVVPSAVDTAAELEVVTGGGSGKRDGGAPMRLAVGKLLHELARSPTSGVASVTEFTGGFVCALRE